MTVHVLDARRRINAAFLLGLIVLARPGCASVDGPSGMLPPGEWGGEHLYLSINDSTAIAEFDCAYGRIAVPILLEGGGFTAAGTFTQGQGGPVREDDEQVAKPARYLGRIAGDRMTITVMVPSDTRTIGTYTLQRGSNGRVVKCL